SFHQPEPGADPAERRRDERLAAAGLEEQDDAAVDREVRRDRLEGSPEGRGLPRPWRPDRRPEQRLERQQRRGLPPERPAGAVVGGPEPLLAEARRRLAQDDADLGLGRRPRPRLAVRLAGLGGE